MGYRTIIIVSFGLIATITAMDKCSNLFPSID